MNQVLLIGRLAKDPEIQEQNGKSHTLLTLAVRRDYKNMDGEYETDFINCTAWNVIADRVCEYCKKGDMISVKGHIQNYKSNDEDNKNPFSYNVVAEKISFLQTEKIHVNKDSDSKNHEYDER